MVGIVLVTHCNLGKALIEAARFISGNLRRVKAVSVQDEGIEDLRTTIAKAIEAVDEGDGVLILTDMFGGTPSNLSFSFLEPGKREVITGVNLPMLLSAINKQDSDLKTLAAFVKQKAISSIIHATEELNQ
ncbi:MAG: PTS sugar transporter [Candidatus Desulfofervidus auxilii]|nr:PTS sugar transporter [Candidatus Desulfofervidus auxilii]